MFTASSLFASLVWGAIGSGIFIYGWKQKSTIPVAGGLLMAGMTYFVASAFYMSLIGVLILATMYWIKRQGY
ncbi:MAG: hypothetical protein JWR19_1718 [Pedosphaera sp.]|nr:hypothetical protein [Pedosphaera sp.]